MNKTPTKQSLSDFFNNRPSLLPSDFQSVVWHPSAGSDFSPLIVYSQGYLQRKEALNDLTPATFHVMTCMGVCEESLLACLDHKDKILFEDDHTRIAITEHQMLELKKKDLWQAPAKRHFNLGKREDFFRERKADGFIAQIELISKEARYQESVPLLYLLSENIATYRHFVKSGLFKVRHIKAVCEGLGFGGCSRSLVSEICESQLGLESLESLWLQEGAAANRLAHLPPDYQFTLRPMPMAFPGELAHLSPVTSNKIPKSARS
jgi:hypothetical protein